MAFIKKRILNMFPCMELPAFIPQSLRKYETVENETALFQTLSSHPFELIQFFLAAASHEAWCESHLQLMKEMLDWLTLQSFENRLGNSLTPVAQAIQQHHKILYGLLPLNITFVVEQEPILVNSLIFSYSSPIFKDMILYQLKERKQQLLVLDNLTLGDFRLIEEHVKKGESGDLWKRAENELLRLREVVSFWGVFSFANEIEAVLKRYLTQGNCISTLVKAYREHWLVLFTASLEFVNRQNWPIKIETDSLGETLSFSFLDFNAASLSFFEELKEDITSIHVAERLMDDPAFSYVINATPKLKKLDLNHTTTWSERLRDCPTTIFQLDLSFCVWLTADYLNTLAHLFPNLRNLVVHSNTQLGVAAWGKLRHFEELVDLDISYNSQVGDDELRMILEACPHLTDFACEECRKLTDRGFYDIVRLAPRLHSLRLKQAAITDGILVEMSQRLVFLHEIKIDSAPNLSDRGLLEFVRQAGALRLLDIRNCHFRAETLAEIKKIKPMLALKT